jgi:ABC-type spermidine/putrescine transport system permease subunit II
LRLIVASSSARVALLLGFAVAYSHDRNKRLLSSTMYYLCFAPLAIPSITMGIALIDAWNRSNLDVIYGEQAGDN